MKNFRIVVLNSPYDNWQAKETREMFAKMVSLKLSGYRREYKYGVLPLDTSDFIATHQFICLETKQDGLVPIIAFRSLGLKVCRLFPLQFPPLTLMTMLGHHGHRAAIDSLIQENSGRQKDLVYGSSMAIEEKFKGEPAIKDILMAMDVHFQTEGGFTSAMTGAVVRFKVDRLFRMIGYVPLSHAEIELGPIPIPFVHQEPTLFMRLEKFSALALTQADAYASAWNDRIVIGDQPALDKQEAA